jgi:hypothetical protein
MREQMKQVKCTYTKMKKPPLIEIIGTTDKIKGDSINWE